MVQSESVGALGAPAAGRPGRGGIALIGDSFTMGWGVLYEETYGALIEERLNRASGGRRGV
jgi:hypothetical protein